MQSIINESSGDKMGGDHSSKKRRLHIALSLDNPVQQETWSILSQAKNKTSAVCEAVRRHCYETTFLVTLYHNFKHVVESMDLPEVRFHTLRHIYAVAALSAGVEAKAAQANLGHATASFTLNVYAHVTEQMNRASADKMQQYINNVTAG